ncbi:hypothetical protein MMC21_003942 [Puttea exsequens]|nr:hypothetical protein [Puttea exsequens]
MSSIFGNTTGGSLFGQNNQDQQQNTTNPFGNATTTSTPSLFSGLNTTASQLQTSGGLFGTASQPQQAGPLFPNIGTSTNQQHSQAGGGLFGNQQQSTQQGGSLFGGQQNSTQQGGGLFGNIGGSTNQQPQQQGGGGLFGNLGATTNLQPQQQNQQQQGGGLFGSIGQGGQQPQQNQQQQGSVLGQSRRLFTQSEAPLSRQSVTAQIEQIFSKWNAESASSPFQTYLYNNVPADQAPFYGPTPYDNPEKWEEALRKKPSPGAIPILVKGFGDLASRMKMQAEALAMLQGRLHEINDGLNTLLQKHDLSISIRAAECRRRHLRLSRQCLGLAAKTQLLRNRGYAMDSAEEELRKKLLLLERSVLDPSLNGRGEEIWARMVSVRERGRLLQRGFEKAGRGMQGKEQVVDEEVIRRVKKILEDYSSQLAQLAKELAQIEKDWAEWERSSKSTSGR